MVRSCIIATAAVFGLGLCGSPAPARATDALEMTRMASYKVIYKKGSMRWREEGGYNLYDANRRADDLRKDGYTVFVQRDD